jgi:hypothetical protein
MVHSPCALSRFRRAITSSDFFCPHISQVTLPGRAFLILHIVHSPAFNAIFLAYLVISLSAFKQFSHLESL